LPKAALTLDLDWFYRRPAPWLWQHIVLGVDRLFGVAENATRGVVHGVARLSGDPVAFGRRTAAPGDAADVADGRRTYDPDRYRAPIGTLIVAVLLGFVLLLSWNLLKYGW
jgi:multicomponent Na+:H+ antiporter subunit D